MRRIYFSFFDGWPGAGLLLLRLALSCSLLTSALSGLGLAESLAGARLLEAVAAIPLLVGLWTPIAGIVIALIELGTLLMTTAPPELSLLRCGVGLSLALLGPGIWSIDGRLYGRRRVEINSLHGN